MKKNIIYLLLIIFLSLLILFYFWPQGPIASWIFYGQKGEMIKGDYYPPEADSATGNSVSIPEIPTQDGLRFIYDQQCYLKMKIKDQSLTIGYFADGYIQAELRQTLADDITPTLLIDWRFTLPNALHYWVERTKEGEYQGWIWDNMASNLIPVRYTQDQVTLLEGTSYTLEPGGNWRYKRWNKGQVVEDILLDILPKKTSYIPPKDQQLAEQAKQQLQQIASTMTTELELPFELDLWQEGFCHEYKGSDN
nr:hypothetical protein [uncultured Moellerella sp.]